MGLGSGSVPIRHCLISVKGLVAEETKRRTVVVVRSRFGDYVDGGACRAAVYSREALRGDLEFLHRLRRKLHHGAAYGVVLVVNAVDGYVDVASAVAIHGQN